MYIIHSFELPECYLCIARIVVLLRFIQVVMPDVRHNNRGSWVFFADEHLIKALCHAFGMPFLRNSCRYSPYVHHIPMLSRNIGVTLSVTTESFYHTCDTSLIILETPGNEP